MLHRIEFEQWVGFPIERVFRFFADPRNLPRIMPAKMGIQLDNLSLVRPADVPSQIEGAENFAGVGSVIPTSVRPIPFLPLRVKSVNRISEFGWNSHFADVMDKGPFQVFHHWHELRSENRNGQPGTLVRDRIELEVGFGVLGDLLFRAFIAGEMKRTFQHRQRVLPDLLAAG